MNKTEKQNYVANISKRIIADIEAGKVAMKPRWHFALHAATLAAALLSVVLLSLFIARTIFFHVRVSEMSELTGMGPRGWTEFALHFPWPFLVSDVALIAAIIWGFRHFRNGARIPSGVLLLSLLGIVSVTGFALDRMHFAPRFMMGRPPLPPGSGVCRCEVKSVEGNHIIATDAQTGKIYTIIVPINAEHATTSGLVTGDHIFVAGEEKGDEIRAFGLRLRHEAHELFDDEVGEPHK